MKNCLIPTKTEEQTKMMKRTHLQHLAVKKVMAVVKTADLIVHVSNGRHLRRTIVRHVHLIIDPETIAPHMVMIVHHMETPVPHMAMTGHHMETLALHMAMIVPRMAMTVHPHMVIIVDTMVMIGIMKTVLVAHVLTR